MPLLSRVFVTRRYRADDEMYTLRYSDFSIADARRRTATGRSDCRRRASSAGRAREKNRCVSSSISGRFSAGIIIEQRCLPPVRFNGTRSSRCARVSGRLISPLKITCRCFSGARLSARKGRGGVLIAVPRGLLRQRGVASNDGRLA